MENVLSLEVSKRGYDISNFVGISQEKEIENVVKNNKLLIIQQEKQYYEIDVREAMKQLANCGSLIQLAYASTNGFQCQSEVVKLLSKYQTLVKNSYIASTEFVTSSITALKYHKTALDIVLKKPDLSIKFVMRCSDLAGKMSSLAGDLYKECEILTSIGEQALVEAVKDKSVSDQERENIQKQISEAKAEEDKLKTLTQSMNQQLSEVREEEAKAIKDAKTERDRQHSLRMLKIVMAPVSQLVSAVTSPLNQLNPLNISFGSMRTSNGVQGVQENKRNNDGDRDDEKKQNNNNDDMKKPDLAGKTADERACMLTQHKYEIQNKLISQNAELAKTVAQLQGYKGKENKLNRGLKSIEIAIKTLGKIKVIFSNTQLFWKGVETNCKRLVQIGGNVELLSNDTQSFKEEIRDAIIQSGLNWFTLCKVNYDAKKAIIQVDKGMDAILNDLPDENEAILLVKQLSKTMITELKHENQLLNKQITLDTDN